MDASLVAIISAAIGAICTAVARWAMHRGSLEDRRRGKLHDIIDKKQKRIERLSDTVSAQRTELIMLQSGELGAFPFPAWFIDLNGRMLYCNSEYERVFIPAGKTAVDYIGRTHSEFWGPEIGEVFERNDSLLNNAGDYFIGTEGFQAAGLYLYLKFPVFVAHPGAGRIKLGVRGVALPVSRSLCKELADHVRPD